MGTSIETTLSTTQGFYYLQLGEIKGNTGDDRHKGWARLNSFRWSETLVHGEPVPEPNYVVKLTNGVKVSPDRFTFVAEPNQASTDLMLRVATGGVIAKPVVLEVCGVTGAPAPVMRFEMQGAKVLSYELGGGSSTGPYETFTLGFSKLKFEWLLRKVQTAFNFAENKKV
jgi:type VI protein secretion system component Hcp